MNRSRDYYRRMRERKINHKKSLSESICENGFYNIDGKYSKNKIHCSCSLCRGEVLFSTQRKLDRIARTLKEEQAI